MTFTTRRGFLVGGAILAAGVAQARVEDVLADMESRHGGRMGFSALDMQSGRRIRWRAGERFAMCSTFKVALVAEVLARIDRRGLSPDRVLTFDPEKLLGTSRASALHPQPMRCWS